MGEPALPTPAEREWARDFAAKVYDSVRDDEEMPQPRWPDGDAMADDTLIFKLSQELLLLFGEVRALLAVAKREVIE